MRGQKTSLKITLSEQERTELERRKRSLTLPVRCVRRAHTILLVSDNVPLVETGRRVGFAERHVRKWVKRFLSKRLPGLDDLPRPGRPSSFPPEVALHTVKIACERPDTCGRSLSQWDCQEIVRQLIAEGWVGSISVETIRRILHSHRLKPWRKRMWLSPKVPRDQAFAEVVRTICDLYTRPLEAYERVFCVDEHTSIQPRPRLCPTRASQPGQPTQVEHEYKRCGALNLLGALDTRSGQVFGEIAPRKRQVEFIPLLEQIDAALPETVTHIYVILDNVPMHTGKQVKAWLAAHPRFILVHPPVHCSWMNQIEQWFSILVRKRLRIADFASLEHLAQRLRAFIQEWNEHAHGFHWTVQSFQKILNKCEQGVLATAA